MVSSCSPATENTGTIARRDKREQQNKAELSDIIDIYHRFDSFLFFLQTATEPNSYVVRGSFLYWPKNLSFPLAKPHLSARIKSPNQSFDANHICSHAHQTHEMSKTFSNCDLIEFFLVFSNEFLWIPYLKRVSIRQLKLVSCGRSGSELNICLMQKGSVLKALEAWSLNTSDLNSRKIQNFKMYKIPLSDFCSVSRFRVILCV